MTLNDRMNQLTAENAQLRAQVAELEQQVEILLDPGAGIVGLADPGLNNKLGGDDVPARN